MAGVPVLVLGVGLFDVGRDARSRMETKAKDTPARPSCGFANICLLCWLSPRSTLARALAPDALVSRDSYEYVRKTRIYVAPRFALPIW